MQYAASLCNMGYATYDMQYSKYRSSFGEDIEDIPARTRSDVWQPQQFGICGITYPGNGIVVLVSLHSGVARYTLLTRTGP